MKMIKVDMTAKTIRVEDLPAAYKGLGGRALTSGYINDHVPATCDALGPENILIFAPGYFSATPLVNTSRLSVGAKSPLTGGIKESNVGGTVAAALGNLGISAIVVEGQAPAGETWLLKIPGGMSVVEYVLLGRSAQQGYLGVESREDLDAVHQALVSLDLDSLAGRRLESLSGGELQRVVLARAVAARMSSS